MIVKPPEKLVPCGAYYNDAVFLAGSIEMGAAEEWQAFVGPELEANGWDVYNPRRDDWDSSWEQTMDNPNFTTQVNWELDALENCSAALFYFQPGTKSPITLMEFALHAPRFKQTALVCPHGFWRAGNVHILADRYGIERQLSLNGAIEYLGLRHTD